MIINKVIQVGNSIIRNKSKAVKKIASKYNNKVITNLVDSMGHFGLVGMAAPQIGINLRIFVSKITKTKFRKPTETDPLRVFVNPKIIFKSKKLVLGYEGCGSVAESGLFARIPRHNNIIVEAYDQSGCKFKLQTAGLLARIIQHEIDHLDGKIFLDRLENPSTLMSKNEYLLTKKK